MRPVFIPAPRLLRYVNMCGGILPPVVGIVSARSGYEGDEDWAIVAAILVTCALIGLVMAIRSLRLGVQCNADAFIVHGLFWSRRVPLDRIDRMPDAEDLGSLPFIRWRGTTGRWRATPLYAFWISGIFAGMLAPGVEESLHQLASWRRGA